jgi:uncharacterized tellurite resistance protein B-like protein
MNYETPLDNLQCVIFTDGELATVLHALCCVVVSDGKINPNELRAIHFIMNDIKSAWSEEKIDEAVNNFLERAKSESLVILLEEVCASLSQYSGTDKGDLIIHHLDVLAMADDSLQLEEESMIKRLLQVLQ